jgi:REP element-mobilizing transposase RayT
MAMYIWLVKKSTEIRRGRSCVFCMHVHLVFVTKYRKKVFTKAILQVLEEIFCSVCMDFEAQLIEFDGEKDHVHLLVNYPPKVSVSRLVNSLKGVPLAHISHTFSRKIATLMLEIGHQGSEGSVELTRPYYPDGQDQASKRASCPRKCEKFGLDCCVNKAILKSKRPSGKGYYGHPVIFLVLVEALLLM